MLNLSIFRYIPVILSDLSSLLCKEGMKTRTLLAEKRNIEVGLVCVVCLITFFVNNRVITPDIMESRNIITAREMVYDGHWIVPTLNGELRLEKPPLPTWLTAVAEILSPDNLALQRGMAGLAALLLVFYFWKFARHVLHINPLIPTLLLCTCYNVILMGRTASWDIYCHAFMMGGIYHLTRAGEAPPVAWRHFLAAGVFTGLSILSKGPVSLYALFLPFLLSYGYVYRPSVRKKGLALASVAVVALLLGTAWYVYILCVHPDALTAVLQKESDSWVNHNVRPWWYYWKFFLETGVWSLLLLTAVFLPLADKSRRNDRRWLFSLLWMFASLVLLSLMPEKKSRYLFPLLIPASYLMGWLMMKWREVFLNPVFASPADKVCFRVNTGLIACVVLLLPVAGGWFILRPGYVSWGGWLVFSLFVVILFFYLVRAASKLLPMRLLGEVTLLFLVTECFFMPTLGNLFNNPQMKSIAETRARKELEGVSFYHIDSVPLRIELVYAAHRPIRPVSVDSLRDKLPCVLLTHRPVQEVLPKKILEKTVIIPIDCYDDNHHPRTDRHYSEDFIYYATWLKAEEDTPEVKETDVKVITKQSDE